MMYILFWVRFSLTPLIVIIINITTNFSQEEIISDNVRMNTVTMSIKTRNMENMTTSIGVSVEDID